MGHDIKQLKPKLNGRYQQGYIRTSACNKLFNSQKTQPVIYRSSYEKRFISWLETNPKVKKWGSECAPIPYMYIDGHMHNYYPDFIVEMTNGDVLVIEIKPFNQTIKPDEADDYAYNTYVKNMCKWQAAKKFCDDRNMKFQIVTERTISRL